ncbi:hypothetical protein, partial [Pseudomonas protegens]|uniref:hypothetical protein n=1 Tax=Pseudomonas protegens TaxID=380021 RepID=UPI001CA4869C
RSELDLGHMLTLRISDDLISLLAEKVWVFLKVVGILAENLRKISTRSSFKRKEKLEQSIMTYYIIRKTQLE